MGGFIQEFKEFTVKGNAMDMAVGLIIGAEFGKIVNSLVNDVIMPPLGLVVGGVDFKNLAIHRKAATLDPVTKTVLAPGVDLRYGLFINNIINFIIVAFAVFMAIKAMNAIRKLEVPIIKNNISIRET